MDTGWPWAISAPTRYRDNEFHAKMTDNSKPSPGAETRTPGLQNHSANTRPYLIATSVQR